VGLHPRLICFAPLARNCAQHRRVVLQSPESGLLLGDSGRGCLTRCGRSPDRATLKTDRSPLLPIKEDGFSYPSINSHGLPSPCTLALHAVVRGSPYTFRSFTTTGVAFWPGYRRSLRAMQGFCCHRGHRGLREAPSWRALFPGASGALPCGKIF
jgi:hypothetical protein